MIILGIEKNDKDQIEKVLVELDSNDVWFFHNFNSAVQQFITRPKEEEKPQGE